MIRTHAIRTASLLLLLAAGLAVIAALLMPNPASAATSGHGRYPSPTCTGYTVSADRAWAEHVVGCDSDLSAAQVRTIISLRDLGAEGLSAGVPARQIVDRYTAVLGDRTEAVTLWTATAVYSYGG